MNFWMWVVVSIREKFRILAIFPRSVCWSAWSGSDILGRSSGNWYDIWFANSGM